jgi:hypothetical protein
MTDDTPQKPPPDADMARARRLERWFDIRRIIGGLFVLYGLILVVTGAVGTDLIKNKAAGVNIDLWTGLAMLAFGVLMFTWALVRPLHRVPGESASEQPSA